MFEHGQVVVGHTNNGTIYGKVHLTETHSLIIWEVGTVLPHGKFIINAITNKLAA